MVNAAYSTYLRDMDLGDLLAAARQVRDLQGQPGWQHLLSLIEARSTGLTTRMLNAKLPTHEEFAQIQGELRGLRAVAEAVETVLAVAGEREAEEQHLAEAAHV